jgi:hypothetical protein
MKWLPQDDEPTGIAVSTPAGWPTAPDEEEFDVSADTGSTQTGFPDQPDIFA